jgi:hypothetical protein
MSGFSLDWLDLREAADHRARDPGLSAEAAKLLDAARDPLVVDLGAGSGSTLRALGPLLTRPVRWRLVDGDAALLAEAVRRAGPDAAVETVLLDLGGLVALPLEGATLVTLSAMTDLVSETFLARLVASAASHRAGLYAALGYDGTMAFAPAHPLDDAVIEAFNRDQQRDKGFGPALGPDGAERLAEIADRAGYKVASMPSPWRLGPADMPLARALLEGIASAAGAALEPGAAGDWLAYRLAAAADGTVEVGHRDVLAVPG